VLPVERVEPLGAVVAAEEVRANIQLRLIVTVVLLAILGISVVATYGLIYLWGFGKITLDKAFVKWLGGATIGQALTLLAGVVQNLFPLRQKKPKGRARKSEAVNVRQP
jgi:nitrate reductase NapE component